VRQYDVPEFSFADRIAKQYRLNYHGLTVQERLQLSLIQDVPIPLFKHMLMALPLNEYVILWGNCKEDVPHIEPIAVTFFVSAQEPAFTNQTSSMIWYDLQADKLFLKREDEKGNCNRLNMRHVFFAVTPKDHILIQRQSHEHVFK
jgi:hypothetical protein